MDRGKKPDPSGSGSDTLNDMITNPDPAPDQQHWWRLNLLASQAHVLVFANARTDANAHKAEVMYLRQSFWPHHNPDMQLNKTNLKLCVWDLRQRHWSASSMLLKTLYGYNVISYVWPGAGNPLWGALADEETIAGAPYILPPRGSVPDGCGLVALAALHHVLHITIKLTIYLAVWQYFCCQKHYTN